MHSCGSGDSYVIRWLGPQRDAKSDGVHDCALTAHFGPGWMQRRSAVMQSDFWRGHPSFQIPPGLCHNHNLVTLAAGPISGCGSCREYLKCPGSIAFFGPRAVVEWSMRIWCVWWGLVAILHRIPARGALTTELAACCLLLA